MYRRTYQAKFHFYVLMCCYPQMLSCSVLSDSNWHPYIPTKLAHDFVAGSAKLYTEIKTLTKHPLFLICCTQTFALITLSTNACPPERD